MIVIGTAGHIDHGKSAIVKRLTGTDPDRLPEEKARGMTIDLGFAFRKTTAGEDLAFVDVPGHERFVRNMIAGAGGTDAVMLVIAADDGWMPQSQEHFQIVKLLGIDYGLIVINKIDLVEPDWLDLLEQEVRDKTAGSFLADAPIFHVSAQTGQGFDDLAAWLDELPGKLESKKDIGKARLYIDRSFVRAGMGRVATGTLRGGSFDVGQPISIWPSRAKGKVRTLQSHNEEVQQALPGQRTAMSVTGTEKDVLVRGGVISDRTDLSYYVDHPVLALSLDLLPEAPVEVTDRRQVLFIVGTTEMKGELRMYDQRSLKPGGRGLVFFKPDEPVYGLVGDRYVVRLVTPMVTLGGGVILDHLRHLPRRKQFDSYAYLNDRVNADLDGLLVSELRKSILVPADGLLREAAFSAPSIAKVVDWLIGEKVLGRFKDMVFHREYLDAAVDEFKKAVEAHLEEKSHLKGLTLETIVALSPFDKDTARLLVEYLLAEKVVVQTGELYSLAGRGMVLKGVIKEAHDQIMKTLQENPLAPPTLAALAGKGKVHQQAIKYMIDTGEVYKCGAEFLFLIDTWRDTMAYIREKLERDGALTVAELREKFGFTRKWVIPILEETDRLQLTKREGDVRTRGDRFEDQNLTV